jgi:hypothetical protein
VSVNNSKSCSIWHTDHYSSWICSNIFWKFGKWQMLFKSCEKNKYNFFQKDDTLLYSSLEDWLVPCSLLFRSSMCPQMSVNIHNFHLWSDWLVVLFSLLSKNERRFIKSPVSLPVRVCSSLVILKRLVDFHEIWLVVGPCLALGQIWFLSFLDYWVFYIYCMFMIAFLTTSEEGKAIFGNKLCFVGRSIHFCRIFRV